MYRRKHDYFFHPKEILAVDRWQLLRLRGKDTLSSKAQLKLEWIIFYYSLGNGDATKTAKQLALVDRHFTSGSEDLSSKILKDWKRYPKRH